MIEPLRVFVSDFIDMCVRNAMHKVIGPHRNADDARFFTKLTALLNPVLMVFTIPDTVFLIPFHMELNAPDTTDLMVFSTVVKTFLIVFYTVVMTVFIAFSTVEITVLIALNTVVMIVL